MDNRYYVGGDKEEKSGRQSRKNVKRDPLMAYSGIHEISRGKRPQVSGLRF